MKLLPEGISIVEIAVVIGVIYMIATGTARTLITRAKKVKTPGVELEFEPSVTACDAETAASLKAIWAKLDTLKNSMTDVVLQIGHIRNDSEVKMTEIQGELAVIVKKVDNVFVDQCKLMFYSDTLSDEERLVAGLKYVAAGFNHTVKRDTIDFAVLNPQLYRAIVKVAPHLQVPEVDVEMPRK